MYLALSIIDNCVRCWQDLPTKFPVSCLGSIFALVVLMNLLEQFRICVRQLATNGLTRRRRMQMQLDGKTLEYNRKQISSSVHDGYS